MAKQVIEYGKFNVKTCSECECKFTFDPIDLTKNGTVACPLCGEENSTVYKFRIPPIQVLI